MKNLDKENIAHSKVEFESDFLDLLFLGNGYVGLIHAAFDESYGEDGLLAVSGLVFDKKGARGLTKAWSNMLTKGGRDLPFFRMSACAHRNWPFDKLSKAECDKVAREAIALIIKHSSGLTITTVDAVEFEKKVPQGQSVGNVRAYPFCVWNSLMHVRSLLQEGYIKGQVAYIFEAGDAKQSEANWLMNNLFADDTLRREYAYYSHSFVEKRKSALVQAADLIAWQSLQDRKRELKGERRRRDMQAIMVGTGGVLRHIDVDAHADTVSRTMRQIAEQQQGH